MLTINYSSNEIIATGSHDLVACCIQERQTSWPVNIEHLLSGTGGGGGITLNTLVKILIINNIIYKIFNIFNISDVTN